MNVPALLTELVQALEADPELAARIGRALGVGTPELRRANESAPYAPAAMIGAQNSVAVTGAPWRHWRDHAPDLGVRIYTAGRKRFIVFDELLAALRRQSLGVPMNGASSDAEARVLAMLGKRVKAPATDEEAVAQVLAMLGKRVKAGADQSRALAANPRREPEPEGRHHGSHRNRNGERSKKAPR